MLWLFSCCCTAGCCRPGPWPCSSSARKSPTHGHGPMWFAPARSSGHHGRVAMVRWQQQGASGWLSTPVPGRAPRAASHLLDVANLQPQCPPCAYSWPLRRSAGPGPRCWCHRQPRLWRQGDRCKGWTTRQGDRCKTTMPLRSFVWPTLAAPPEASPTASSTSWT